MGVPDGWHREYEGRHGAEFFYEPRNLTVSVLPRYESARGRASEKEPSNYVVRVHRLLTPDPSVPVTLGRRETFEGALALAEKYMRRVETTSIRSATAGAFEAFADVAAYDDDVLLALCRSAAGSAVSALVHADGDALEVAHAVGRSPERVRDRVGDRVDALRTCAFPDDEAVYVARPDGDLAWLPRGEADGTLVVFADADGDLGAFLDEIGRFVRRRPKNSGA